MHVNPPSENQPCVSKYQSSKYLRQVDKHDVMGFKHTIANMEKPASSVCFREIASFIFRFDVNIRKS